LRSHKATVLTLRWSYPTNTNLLEILESELKRGAWLTELIVLWSDKCIYICSPVATTRVQCTQWTDCISSWKGLRSPCVAVTYEIRIYFVVSVSLEIHKIRQTTNKRESSKPLLLWLPSKLQSSWSILPDRCFFEAWYHINIVCTETDGSQQTMKLAHVA
jgi:hypothetical protein